MKNLRTHAVCVCLSLMSICSYAQSNTRPPLNEPDYNKPRLFNNLPERIPFSVTNVTSLFNASIGAAVDLGLSDTVPFTMDGEVIATSFSDKVQKLVVRSSNYPGANMTISKVTNNDGSVSYHGRILSIKHGDFYELQKSIEGYVLVKKSFYDLINE
ncbi:MAG: hypothetical protein KBF82_12600 [Chitinophagaceae bacterium]|nr:hypothetical protein [Chitinophagaceae bacterium]MBP9104701.1 hypothetical protein [Chitinophagaceae bacterium]